MTDDIWKRLINVQEVVLPTRPSEIAFHVFFWGGGCLNLQQATIKLTDNIQNVEVVTQNVL